MLENVKARTKQIRDEREPVKVTRGTHAGDHRPVGSLQDPVDVATPGERKMSRKQRPRSVSVSRGPELTQDLFI